MSVSNQAQVRDAVGAVLNLSSDNDPAWARSQPGSTFNIALSSPIVFDGSGHTITLISYSVAFASPNIGPASILSSGNADLENTFTYTNSNAGTGPLGTFTVTFLTGLYSVQDIQASLTIATTANGHGTIALPLFQLYADTAGVRITIIVNYLGITIDFATGPNEITSILGFAETDLGPTTMAPQSFVGGLRPDFPQGVTSYVIHCSLITDSYLGGLKSTPLVLIPLNASPGEQIILTNPSNLNRVPCSSQSIQTMRFWLTDPTGLYIVNEEVWSLAILIR